MKLEACSKMQFSQAHACLSETCLTLFGGLFVDFDVLYPFQCGLCCGYCVYTIYIVRTGMYINEIVS